MKKIRILILLVASVFLISCGKENTEKKVAKEIVISPKISSINIHTEASGTVIPNLEVEIKAKSSGEIIKLPVDIGDFVKKGDLIAELDPEDEQRNVLKAELDLSTATANRKISESNLENEKIEAKYLPESIDSNIKALESSLEYKNAHYKRQLSLLKKKFISQDELQSIKAQLQSTINNLNQAKIDKSKLVKIKNNISMKESNLTLSQNREKVSKLNLEDFRKRLKETKIFSPMDGFISDKFVQFGQIIASGISNVGGGTKLFTISDLSKIYVDTAIDESSIGKINIGNKAFVTVEAFPNKVFKGEVVQIGVMGRLESNIVTFHVKVELKDKDANLLKPGMTATVNIETVRKNNILTVPTAAVKEDEKGFYVIKDNGEKARIKVGINSYTKYEVLSGITKNDKIKYSKTSGKWSADSKKNVKIRMGGHGH